MTYPTTILSGLTVADADLAGVRAAQVNPYGRLLPRSMSAFEFRAVAGNLAINDQVRSQHLKGQLNNENPAICIGNFNNYAAANKGLLSSGQEVYSQKIQLPAHFDLRNSMYDASNTNVLIYIWLTQKTKATSGSHSITGYGYANVTNAQWYLAYNLNSGAGYQMRVVSSGLSLVGHDFGEIADDTPTLFGLHCRPVEDDPLRFTVDAYLDGVLAGTSATKGVWPINDLSGFDGWLAQPDCPVIGYRGGYNNLGHEIVVHSLGMARITEFDDVAAFMADEYAANAAALAA